MATTYSNRSNALRAAKKAGYTKDDIVIKQIGDRFAFESKASIETRNAEHDAKLDAEYGFHTCPECEVHLSNGVCDFEGLLDARGGDFNEAYKLQQKEFACMACDAEWGEDVKHPQEDKAKSGRPYKRTGENTEAPGTLEHGTVTQTLFALYDDLYTVGNRTRKEYIAAGVEAGANRNSASCGFTKWKKSRKIENM